MSTTKPRPLVEQLAFALMATLGIYVGETSLTFHTHKQRIADETLNQFLDALEAAMTLAVAGNALVSTKRYENKATLCIDGLATMEFKRSFFGGWVYRQRICHVHSVHTVRHGEFLGGLVGAALNAIFYPDPQPELA